MRTNISVVIFDKFYKKHNYKDVKSEAFYDDEATNFDMHFFIDAKNVAEKLNTARGFDAIITVGNIDDFSELMAMPYECRKKWIHFDEFDKKLIASSITATFKINMTRKRDENNKLFSIFTCGYKTTKEMAFRLYNSLLKQTYDNWNWWIIDDTPEGEESAFSEIHDWRVNIIKNVTTHGNIGFNKHLIAMCCDGDYLVEVDHDDELTSDCLALLKKAFDTYEDCTFAYSYCIEEIGGRVVTYGDYFALGLGENVESEADGYKYTIPNSPNVNCLSMRHITAMPNHVRCWERSFYHKIGGHNMDLSIMDDTEIIIRTFLEGKMCKIPKILYIQHEGDYQGGLRGTTTQTARYTEIARTGRLIKEAYDSVIHEYTLRCGHEDPYWDEEGKYSDILSGVKEPTTDVNYVLDI